jgi:hypothetical protein
MAYKHGDRVTITGTIHGDPHEDWIGVHIDGKGMPFVRVKADALALVSSPAPVVEKAAPYVAPTPVKVEPESEPEHDEDEADKE